MLPKKLVRKVKLGNIIQRFGFLQREVLFLYLFDYNIAKSVYCKSKYSSNNIHIPFLPRVVYVL